MISKDTCFANAKGSKDDPKPIDPNNPGERYTSWRQLMRDAIKVYPEYATCCAEKDKIYLSSSGERVGGFKCENDGKEDFAKNIWMHGAHILKGKTASEVPSSDDTVYIVPLCKCHNIYKGITGYYGTGYYMKMDRNQRAVKLKNFMKWDYVQNAILKEELEMEDVKATEKPQLSVGLKFTFMGVDLSAYYTKKTNGYQIFVAPMNVDNKAEISLREMINQFNKMAGADTLSEEDVKNKIESEDTNRKDIKWDTIKFCLKMLFLNINSEADTKTIEYALSLQIIADDLIPKDITVFNVKSLSFNIWNTQRQNVLDKMSLTNPEAF